MANRIGGIIAFKRNGQNYLAKGAFTYGYGFETRETISGSDVVHGYKSAVTPPFIEGEITDDGSVTMAELAGLIDDTITLELGNGKIFALYNAWSTNPDGVSASTEESNISVRFEGRTAKEVRA